MKKTIFTLVLTLLLSGCGTRVYSPIISTNFEYQAVYKSGDFSYSCTVSDNDGVVTVIPSETYAKGMKMICDGKNVVFVSGSMKKTVSVEDITPLNPALVLYSVFESLSAEGAESAKKTDGGYQYSAKVAAGEFTLLQNEDSTYEKLVIPDCEITVEFQNK